MVRKIFLSAQSLTTQTPTAQPRRTSDASTPATAVFSAANPCPPGERAEIFPCPPRPLPDRHASIPDDQSHDENGDQKSFGHSHATPTVADASRDGMPAACPLSLRRGHKGPVMGVTREVVTELNRAAEVQQGGGWGGASVRALSLSVAEAKRICPGVGGGQTSYVPGIE